MLLKLEISTLITHGLFLRILSYLANSTATLILKSARILELLNIFYKYICKGHDKITFHIHNNDMNTEIDEIKEYQSARWVSPPEVTWRLFGFPIKEMNPSVYHL